MRAADAYWQRYRDYIEIHESEDPVHVRALAHMEGIRAAIEVALDEQGVRVMNGSLIIREDAHVPAGMYVINGRLYRPEPVIVGRSMERLLGTQWKITEAEWVNGAWWDVTVAYIDPEYGSDRKEGTAMDVVFEVAIAKAIDNARG